MFRWIRRSLVIFYAFVEEFSILGYFDCSFYLVISGYYTNLIIVHYVLYRCGHLTIADKQLSVMESKWNDDVSIRFSRSGGCNENNLPSSIESFFPFLHKSGLIILSFRLRLLHVLWLCLIAYIIFRIPGWSFTVLMAFGSSHHGSRYLHLFISNRKLLLTYSQEFWLCQKAWILLIHKELKISYLQESRSSSFQDCLWKATS